jgi:hypothetical protein
VAHRSGKALTTKLPAGQLTEQLAKRLIRWRMSVAVRSPAAVGSATIIVGVGAAPAQAVNETSIGRRFDDGLDTRHSVQSFTSAAAAMGYATTGDQNGRSATNTFTDGRSAAVLALFGHADTGIFQTDEGATDATDQILAAGRVTDLISPTPDVLRYVTEYLPLLVLQW